MEERIIKTDVFFNTAVFEETAELPVDADFTLPDYCPDISKLFKCRARAEIAAKAVNGKSITAEGNVCITVLYGDGDGHLCSYEYRYPFSKGCEMHEESEDGFLSATAECEYINCRAVTGRKVDIHGAISISLCVFKRASAQIVSDTSNAPGIEQKCESAPATVPMGYCEKYVMQEEEIPIGQGQPTVGRLLKYELYPTVRESRLINDKAVIKGETEVKILYCPEDSPVPQTVKTVFPFSQIMDMPGVSDACRCEARIFTAFTEIKPKNGDGGIKGFSLTAKLLITCKAFCGSDVPIVTDAFSRKYRANIARESLQFEKIGDNVRETYRCKKSIELAEPIGRIYDLWCELQAPRVKFSENNMSVEGKALICFITADAEGKCGYFEKEIDFEYKYPLKNGEGGEKCEPELQILSCEYNIADAQSVEIRLDIAINAAIYFCRTVSVIKDIEIDEGTLNENRPECAMTIYRTEEDEQVWDIAKRYNAGVNEIMRINNLEEEVLPPGKMLLIPVV